MASSYTTNTGIEKPATGEQSGTWGDTTNTNFDIIDRLASSVGEISLSGTTHTLTTSDGALSEGHYKVLVLGGSPSATNTITISPNDQEKMYLVYNNSGEDAIFTQGSGGNVTVPNGNAKIIFSDGAGSGAAVTDFTGLLDVDLKQFSINGTEVTATAAELNFVDGVTSAIQTQIDAKQATITGAATTIDDTDLTASRAVVSNGSGKIAVSDVTSTELGYLDGVTSAIQTQIDSKQATITGAATSIDDTDLSVDRALISDGSGKVAVSGITATELNQLDGVTSNIQSQIDSIPTPDAIVAPTIQVFSSSGTWTKPSGCTTVKVTVIGGGGGGRGPGSQDVGGGGGGGGTAIEYIDVSSVSSVAVTVGSGGDGGNGLNGAQPGDDGGSSSFGSYCSAMGGSGSTGEGGGNGGVGSNGDLNIGGSGGGRGILQTENSPIPKTGGHGGSSFMGGGGTPNGGAGQSYGGGGAGGVGGQVNGGQGGDGADGVVFVEEYYT